VAGLCAGTTACPTPGPDGGAPDEVGNSDAEAPELAEVAPDTAEEVLKDGPTEPMPPDRSGPFLPSDLDGLVLWLDPTQGITPTPVFIWRDRSPAGNDATAPQNANPTMAQPWADLPAVVAFSGMGQYLVLPAGMRDFTRGLSFFVVAEPRKPLQPGGQVNALRFLDLSTQFGTLEGTALVARFGPDATELLYQVYPTGSHPDAFPTDGGVVPDDTRQLLEIVAPGGNPNDLVTFNYRRNGSFVASGSAFVPDRINRTSNLIGRSNLYGPDDPDDQDYVGFIAEMVLYARDLDGDEVQAVEGYLLDRWHLR
jgi:hypothetical protein